MSRISGLSHRTKGTNIEIEIIPVVNEYPDVFPEDLSGLPLDREVEFA